MKKLIEYLGRKNLDQKVFARMADVTESTLSRVLRNKFKPSLVDAQKIERATKGAVRCMDW